MEPAVKTTSIRCDLHPPLSAIMYCDNCKAFLCRICAEVRPGGRVCSKCKKSCREPSADEFLDLLAQRKKAQEHANHAKATEVLQREQAEKAKSDRDTRLKAEFAARKAALAQQKQAGENSPASAAPNPTASAGTTDIANVPPPPSARVKYIDTADELSTLVGERSYLNVIDRAKVIMLIVSIFTIIFAVWQYFLIADEERIKANERANQHDQWVDSIHRQISKAVKKDDKRELEKELTEDNFGAMGKAVDGTIFFIARVMIGCYIVAAMVLLILRHTTDTSPRGSTIAAFIIFLLLNLLDLAIFGFGNRFLFAVRWAAIVALYKAMHVGIALHQMRAERAAAVAAASAK